MNWLELLILVAVLTAAICAYVGTIEWVAHRIMAIWGRKWFTRFMWTVGLPVAIFGMLLDKLLDILELRELGQVFKIYVLEPGFQNTNQARVDTTLTDLATNFQRACTAQEQVRKKTRVGLLKDMDKWVLDSKSAFWKAHSLAGRNGFNVKDSFRDYLAQ